MRQSRHRSADPRSASVSQVVRIERHRPELRRGVVTKDTTESHYAVTSLGSQEADPNRPLAIARDHWSIENGQHYRRDRTQNEDRCQVSHHAAGAISVCSAPWPSSCASVNPVARAGNPRCRTSSFGRFNGRPRSSPASKWLSSAFALQSTFLGPSGLAGAPSCDQIRPFSPSQHHPNPNGHHSRRSRTAHEGLLAQTNRHPSPPSPGFVNGPGPPLPLSMEILESSHDN